MYCVATPCKHIIFKSSILSNNLLSLRIAAFSTLSSSSASFPTERPEGESGRWKASTAGVCEHGWRHTVPSVYTSAPPSPAIGPPASDWSESLTFADSAPKMLLIELELSPVEQRALEGHTHTLTYSVPLAQHLSPAHSPSPGPMDHTHTHTQPLCHQHPSTHTHTATVPSAPIYTHTHSHCAISTHLHTHTQPLCHQHPSTHTHTATVPSAPIYTHTHTCVTTLLTLRRISPDFTRSNLYHLAPSYREKPLNTRHRHTHTSNVEMK